MVLVGALVVWQGAAGQNLVNEEEYCETVNLTMEDAKRMALENNRTLQNATLETKKAHAQRWQAIATMLPQADVSMQYQNMCGYKMAMSGFKIPLNPNGTISITASIALNGQMVVGALLSDLAIDMQDINRRNTELDLVIDVETMYMTALAMERTISILDSSKTNLETLYKATAGAVEVGAAEQTDADQIEVQLANVKNAISSTERSTELIYNSLALLLGCGPDKKLVLTDDLETLMNIDNAVELLKSDFNIQDNNEYKLAEKNVELAERNVIMAGMAYIPTLSAYYQYSAKTYFGEDEGFNMTPPNVIGVTLSIPLWSSGKNAAGITEKKIAKMEAENQLADARDGLIIAYRQAKYDLINAYENYTIQEKSIDVMYRVMQSTTNKYQYGRASSFDLTNASTNLLNAQNNYISAVITLVNAQKALKQILEK